MRAKARESDFIMFLKFDVFGFEYRGRFDCKT